MVVVHYYTVKMDNGDEQIAYAKSKKEAGELAEKISGKKATEDITQEIFEQLKARVSEKELFENRKTCRDLWESEPVPKPKPTKKSAKKAKDETEKETE
jgi:hypothetical protein